MTTQTRRKVPDRRGGYYWLKDDSGVTRSLVSVTTALNEVAKQDFFVPAAIRKAHAAWSADPSIDVKAAQATWYQHSTSRANVGQMLHSVYEAHGRGAVLLPENLPTEEARGHYRGFYNWFDAVSPEFVHVEAKVANFRYGFAGQMDLIAKIGPKLAIVDYKTGFLDVFSCAMQESAYENADVLIDNATGERTAMPEIEVRYALQTQADGTYRFEQLPDRYMDFLGYLHLWRARRRAEGKEEPCPAACWCQEAAKTDGTYVTVCSVCAMPEGMQHLTDCKYSVFENFRGD